MKKNSLSMTLCTILVSSLLLTACGKSSIKNPSSQASPSQTSQAVQTSQTAESSAGETSQNAASETSPTAGSQVSSEFEVNLEGVTSLAELEDRIEEHLDKCIDSLTDRAEDLSREIDSYEKYIEKKSSVTDFYQTIENETNQIGIMLREYSAIYAKMILDSSMSYDDKYDAVDDLTDCLYDDACDTMCDALYDDLMDDMHDYFYNGVLEKQPKNVDYSDWHDVMFDEYEQLSDTASSVYSTCSDAASDIYSFCNDLSTKLLNEDSERANKVYLKFLKKTDRLKHPENKVVTDAAFDTTLRSASGTDELEDVVEAHVGECIQALYNEWDSFSKQIDSYEKYKENEEAVEAFHEHLEDATEEIFQMISLYGISYAALIMETDLSNKEKYTTMEDARDCIYEDACTQVKEGIYEDLLSEIKDYFYDGIIKDGKKSVDYSDWSDTRSDSYSMWSDARSEVYSSYSDARSDLYSFYSDVRSKLYSGNPDKASKEITKFKEKIEKRIAKGSSSTEDGSGGSAVETTASEASVKETTASQQASSGIRPEFKQVMDDFEAYFDEYCDLLEKYQANPTDLELATKYLSLASKATEMEESVEKWESEDLNEEELSYYLEVAARIEKKLSEIQ